MDKEQQKKEKLDKKTLIDTLDNIYDGLNGIEELTSIIDNKLIELYESGKSDSIYDFFDFIKAFERLIDLVIDRGMIGQHSNTLAVYYSVFVNLFLDDKEIVEWKAVEKNDKNFTVKFKVTTKSWPYFSKNEVIHEYPPDEYNIHTKKEKLNNIRFPLQKSLYNFLIFKKKVRYDESSVVYFGDKLVSISEYYLSQRYVKSKLDELIKYLPKIFTVITFEDYVNGLRTMPVNIDYGNIDKCNNREIFKEILKRIAELYGGYDIDYVFKSQVPQHVEVRFIFSYIVASIHCKEFFHNGEINGLTKEYISNTLDCSDNNVNNLLNKNRDLMESNKEYKAKVISITNRISKEFCIPTVILRL